MAGAGDDDVAAQAAEDGVVGAVLQALRLQADQGLERRGLDPLRQRVGQVRVGHELPDRAVVAEDHIVVGALRATGYRAQAVAVDHVTPGKQVVGHRRDIGLDRRAVVDEGRGARHEGGRRTGIGHADGQRARQDVDVDAGVAVDVVHAALAEDGVVARAAGQVVARLAADEGVVAGTAVGREANRDAIQVHPGTIEQRAGVDDVVACVEVRVGEREDPLVVLVVGIGELGEGVERLLAELHAQHVIRVAAVPDAVLRGVAIDHQRRIRARAAADGDVVATDTHASIEQRVVAEHGERLRSGRRKGSGQGAEGHDVARQAGDGEAPGNARDEYLLA